MWSRRGGKLSTQMWLMDVPKRYRAGSALELSFELRLCKGIVPICPNMKRRVGCVQVPCHCS